MNGWTKAMEVPPRNRKGRCPLRVEADNVISAFIESGDDCWEKDISGDDMQKVLSIYYTAAKATHGKVRSSVRGKKLYLVREDR